MRPGFAVGALFAALLVVTGAVDQAAAMQPTTNGLAGGGHALGIGATDDYLSCGANGPDSYITGFQAGTGAWFDSIGVFCGRYDAASGHVTPVPDTGFLFGGTGGSLHSKMCPADEVVYYIHYSMFERKDINDNQYTILDNLLFRCRPASQPPDYVNDPVFLLTSDDAVGIAGRASRKPSIVGNGVNYGFSHSQGCAPDLAVGLGVTFLSREIDAIAVTIPAAVFGLGLDCGPAPAVAQVALPPAPAGAHAGFDRPGNDFNSYATNDPADCSARCQADGTCKAWSWAAAGTHGTGAATCYLKKPAPTEVTDACCISGVPTALPPAPAGAFSGVDLPGDDFFSFDSANPANCALSCSKNAACAAWTWAMAGTHGAAAAHCYLKKSVPSQVASSCCVSGTVAGGGTAGAPAPGAGVNFSGNWQTTDYAGHVFMMTLSQTPQGVVAGSYDGGTITNGAVKGIQLFATWHEGANSGRLRFSISPDGSGFSGRYNNNPLVDANISDKGWNGVRAGGTSVGGGGGTGAGTGGGTGPDFSGAWQTTINGDTPGKLSLVKSGSGWAGTYSAFGISGAISKGKVGADGHLRFSWSQPGASGKGNFVLSGPASFKGTFYFDANPAAVGSWDGHR